MFHPYKAIQDLTALALREFWTAVAPRNQGTDTAPCTGHASRNHACNVLVCGPGTLRNDGIRITGIDDTPKSDCAHRMQRAILPSMLSPSRCWAWIDRDHTQSLRLRA